MLKSLVCHLLCLCWSIILVSPLSAEDMVVLKMSNRYCIVNKGENHGLSKGQIFYVERETIHDQKNIAFVVVVLTTANEAVVKRLSEGSNIAVGDKLYLAQDAPHNGRDEPRIRSTTTKDTNNTWSKDGDAHLAGLRPGSWIEAKGSFSETEKLLTAEEMKEVKATSSLDPNKMEITGPATSELTQSDSSFTILNYIVKISEKTRFEDADRNQIPRFKVYRNEWLKLKLRIKEHDTMFARVVRRIEPRDRFKILGQVQALATERRQVTIGGVNLIISAQADRDVRQGNPLGNFLDDEQKGVLFSIRPSENIMVGGQVSTKSRADDERDLRRERKRDKQIFSGELKLDLLWRFKGRSFAFVEGVFGVREELRNQLHEETSYPNRLSRAYLYWAISKSLSLQVGRQDFDGKREWIYDETLDGVRLHARLGRVEIELSGSTERKFLTQDNNTPGILNGIALIRAYTGSNHFLSAYIVQRHARQDDGFDFKVLGLRSYSRPRYGLRHWLELATIKSQGGSKEIFGYAFDVGLSRVFNSRLRPTLTASVAFATGDDDLDDQSGAFHQTGLQDNNGKFGGVTSFRYYGEVTDPELSNRLITTFAFGLRPLRNLSADIVFHTYRQHKASTDLGDTRIKANPTGESKDLGWEIDLILGHRFGRRASLELVLGRFQPGSAFQEQDPAHIAQFQIRVKF